MHSSLVMKVYTLVCFTLLYSLVSNVSRSYSFRLQISPRLVITGPESEGSGVGYIEYSLEYLLALQSRGKQDSSTGIISYQT